MSAQQRSSLLRGVVSLVGTMGGRLESRIRLQKAAYLLKMLDALDFREAPFRYHHYGPYSRALSDALQEAVASGLLNEEKQERGEEQTKYLYTLSDAGRAWLDETVKEGDPLLARTVPLFRDAHWRSLELASTVLFVERDEQIRDRAESTRRALQLKPPCKEHVDAARSLLDQLGL